MNMFFTNHEYKMSSEDKQRENLKKMAWENEQEKLKKEHETRKPEPYGEPYEWGEEFGYVKH